MRTEEDRKRTPKRAARAKPELDVASGLVFDNDEIDAENQAEEEARKRIDNKNDALSEKPFDAATDTGKANVAVDTEEYADNKYYTPQPKTGTKGGRLGRPPANSKNRQKSDSDIDSDKPSYKSGYKAHPKEGKNGGRLGRPVLSERQRKVQFNVTCTPDQKESYKKAAERENVSLPAFINRAIEDYIKRNKLY